MSAESVAPFPGGPAPGLPLPVIKVEYRTAGAFLIAYSSQLSRGELFLETETPWPAGSRALLSMQVEDMSLDLDGLVTWTRPEATGPGQPAGMCLSLSPSIEAHGAIVDRLASRYVRTRILLATGEPARRAMISRHLRSILSCDLVELNLQSNDPADRQNDWMVETPIDLAIVDFDSAPATGARLVSTLRGRPDREGMPIVVLSQLERDRARAVSLGADEALTNPPVPGELQSAVIHCLSRPRAWVTRPND